MAGLSIIIPVEAQDQRPASLISAIAAKPSLDIELLVVAGTPGIAASHDLDTLKDLDSRVRVVVPDVPAASTLSLWCQGALAARGQWLTLVRPDDIIEPEALTVAEFVKGRLGAVDAIGWNALQVSPTAEPGKSPSMAIPTKYDIAEFDKTDMLKAFYLWEGAGNQPKMPFGLYHAMISRELAETVASTIMAAGREHELANWEWAARTVLMGEKFVFCSRPLSVINVRPYAPPVLPLVRSDFPFHAGLGLPGGIAEIQFSVFAEMGALWTGSQENFIRAITIDCMLESDPQVFNDKANGYYRALRQWEGGQYASMFKPQFAGERPLDRRRGLHGNVLMIDRHIAGAKNAQEFYGIIRNFLVPIGIICGGQAV